MSVYLIKENIKHEESENGTLGRSYGSSALSTWPERTTKDGGKSSASCSIRPPRSLSMIIMRKLAKSVFKFTRAEKMQTFQLPLILDLTVLSAPSGLLFSLICYCKLCISETLVTHAAEALGNVWLNEEERRSDADCKKKSTWFFCITSSTFKFIACTEFHEPYNKRRWWREHSHSTVTASLRFLSSRICLLGSYLIWFMLSAL